MKMSLSEFRLIIVCLMEHRQNITAINEIVDTDKLIIKLSKNYGLPIKCDERCVQDESM